MNILISGGSSPIAIHIANFLVRRGYNVFTLTRNKFINFSNVSGAYNNIIDINVRIDIVLDLQGSNIPNSTKLALEEANHTATTNLAKWASENRVIFYVHFSTVSIWDGNHQVKISELSQASPLTLYSYFKLESEIQLQKLSELEDNKTKYFVLNLPAILAPKSKNHLPFRILDAIKNFREIEIYGLSRIYNYFIDVDDLSNFLVNLFRLEISTLPFKVVLGHEEVVTLGGFISAVASNLNIPPHIVENYENNSHKIIDDSYARGNLGWVNQDFNQLISTFVKRNLSQ